jgi:hypothetical protein
VARVVVDATMSASLAATASGPLVVRVPALVEGATGDIGRKPFIITGLSGSASLRLSSSLLTRLAEPP